MHQLHFSVYDPKPVSATLILHSARLEKSSVTVFSPVSVLVQYTEEACEISSSSFWSKPTHYASIPTPSLIDPRPLGISFPLKVQLQPCGGLCLEEENFICCVLLCVVQVPTSTTTKRFGSRRSTTPSQERACTSTKEATGMPRTRVPGTRAPTSSDPRPPLLPPPHSYLLRRYRFRSHTHQMRL